MQTGLFLGTDTPPAEEIGDMGALLDAVENRWPLAPRNTWRFSATKNARYNRDQYVQPFLSCFCRDCIGRGLDINDGGALYPSVHGVCGMGIATMADSLAAIEQVVFQQKKRRWRPCGKLLKPISTDMRRCGPICWPPQNTATISILSTNTRSGLWNAMPGSFPGTKRGTAAVFIWPSPRMYRTFRPGWRSPPPPDGRLNGTPLSDAASPMHGRDRDGPTTAFHSLAKPDYTLAGGRYGRQSKNTARRCSAIPKNEPACPP